MIADDCSLRPPGQRVHLQVHHSVPSALLAGHGRPERGGVPRLHPRALHVHPLLPLAGEQRHQSRRANTGVCVSQITSVHLMCKTVPVCTCAPYYIFFRKDSC